jgi:hypothetical protein
VWKIGDIEITPVIELEIVGGTRFILPQASREEVMKIGWLQPHFADPEGRLKMAVQSFLIKTPSRRIIVDTGLGNDKQGRGVPRWNDLQTPFLADIAANGFAADAQWVPTFPNARYVWSREEYEYWHAHRADPDVAPHYADSIEPVVNAGRVDFVDSDHRFSPEIRFIPTAGHSPAHMSIAIESGGRSAILLGDVFHHPCQIAHLDWAAIPIDIDPAQSTETRRTMCERLAGTKTLAIGGHFTGPGAGYIVRDGGRFRLEPAL